MTPASYHESPYLAYCTIYSLHTDQPLQKVYADKGYFGEPNRDFLNLNDIEDGIMRKDSTTAKFYPVKYVLRTFAGKHICCYLLGQ